MWTNHFNLKNTVRTTRANAARSTAPPWVGNLASLLIAGFLLGLAGCGGENEASPTEPGNTGPISFAPVAGSWVGNGITDDQQEAFSIEMTLGESAANGDSVGAARYRAEDGSFDCSGTLFAVDAEDDVYTARQDITSGTGCSNGQVQLTHDPDEGTLLYEYFIGGEHTSTGSLRRP
jgi:hypothetical protein